jgi:hypothetical protein
MTGYLRNLLRRLRGRSLARGSAHPAKTTRLEVERLQDRIVPTIINLVPLNFTMPGAGTLHVSTELPTGAFWGTFHDVNSNWDIPVVGQLTSLGPRTDNIVFHGAAAKPQLGERETVSFVGEVVDYRPAAPELMTGTLTENYWLDLPGIPPLHWAVTRPEEAFGL